MKLPVPFIQLPLLFDAGALAAEIASFDETLWRPHPSGTPGNSALPLIAVEGDPEHGDALEGPMRATPALQRSPYMQRVVGSLQAVLGRSRLMRLSGRAEVQQHVDIDYYWNERVRVHVPILTQPSVRFVCGDAMVNMAQGECWIFDTWRQHNVINEADAARIHLVVDTVGGSGFWDMVNAGRSHALPAAGWRSRFVAANPDDRAPDLMFESVNSQSPMSYWELRDLMEFLLGEAEPHPQLQAVARRTTSFVRQWQTLWFHHGADEAALADYRRVRNGFVEDIAQLAGAITLRNGGTFAGSARGLLSRAVSKTGADATVEMATPASGTRSKTPSRQEATDSDAFDRPIFIVSPPRSGSSLFFETMAHSPSVYTIGGESHGVIEGIAELGAASRGYASNRLDESDATPQVIEQLRQRFHAKAFDREKRPAHGRIRLLEKTPKNALRIPFLNQVFPDALFVYLYRDPRQVLASMLEAWETGGFRTYRQLPGWTGLPWSLLLTPGWRSLIGRPLPQIVGAQWETATRVLLDDLERLPAQRRCVARYDALMADPDAEISRICAAVDVAWDRTLGRQLPLARYTVSKPQDDKWRQREHEIQPELTRMADTIRRAAAFAER